MSAAASAPVRLEICLPQKVPKSWWVGIRLSPPKSHLDEAKRRLEAEYGSTLVRLDAPETEDYHVVLCDGIHPIRVEDAYWSLRAAGLTAKDLQFADLKDNDSIAFFPAPDGTTVRVALRVKTSEYFAKVRKALSDKFRTVWSPDPAHATVYCGILAPMKPVTSAHASVSDDLL